MEDILGGILVSVLGWAPEHKLLLVGLQGKKVDASHMPPSNLVFLIDVSGSMQSEDKLPLLKSSLHLLVKQLRPQDKISMVVYAGSAGLVLPSTRGHQKATILAAVDRLEAGGSTAGGAGIQLAYNVAKENFIHGGINRVILATDGDFNVGVSNDEELVKIIEEKRQTGVSLSVLGFGTGNLKDSRMEKLADKGNGNYSYIDGLLEAKKVLVSQISGTLNTIAKDVKIQVEFNPSHVQAYRLIGYENRVLNKEDFNNDKKDAGEIGAGHEVTALYEVVPMGAAMDNTVDPLKYQKPQIVEEPSTRYTDEIATVKFRYKKPDGDKSILLTHVVTRESYRRWVPSGNITFATAVAGFGMLLRNSEYTGALRYGDVIALAKSAIGPDENGNRAEFVKLVRTADVLAETTSASLGVIRE
jgi:Ca-activated chloride channel family protein